MPETAVKILFERYGPKYQAFVTFTVVLGIVSMLLNATMINVAIPVIMGAFGVGQGTAHWLVTGYIASMTVAMLLNDWFVRSFGMRTTYLGAMAIFAIGAFMGGEPESRYHDRGTCDAGSGRWPGTAAVHGFDVAGISYSPARQSEGSVRCRRGCGANTGSDLRRRITRRL